VWFASVLAAAILEVPYVPQVKDTCGAASLAMVMRYWQSDVTHDAIAGKLLKPELSGIAGSHLQDFARDRGMTAVAYVGDMDLVREYLGKGRPLIVALKVGNNRYHNVVVVGYDEEKHELVLHDPAEGPSRRMAEAAFEKRWSGSMHWTLLILPPQPTPSPSP